MSGCFGNYPIGGLRRESARRRERKILEPALDYFLYTAVLSHREIRRGQTPDGLAIRILNRHSPGNPRCGSREGEGRLSLSREKGDVWNQQEEPDRPHASLFRRSPREATLSKRATRAPAFSHPGAVLET